jgi:ferric-dicitrate binding protein FerR (iron transport regulator)
MRYRGFALAASIALAFIAFWSSWMRSPPQLVAIASPGGQLSIERARWVAWVPSRDGKLFQGDVLRSGAAGAVVQRVDGSELRLAHDSNVLFVSSTELQLQSGQLFVDTHPESGTKKLRVLTAFGSVEHLGTQFLVSTDNAQMTVAVRNGQVALHYAQQEPIRLQNGQAANLDSHGSVRRWDLAAFDDIWGWADSLAAPLDIEGRTLFAVLSRIAQRSGLTLKFVNAEAETGAQRLTLHGAPLNLPPRAALDAVLATGSFSGTVEGRQIVVTAR